MGEYTDPSYNFLNTVQQMAELSESHKMLNVVKEAGIKGGWLNDKITKYHYVPVPSANTKNTNNPLEGLYTTEAMAESLGKFMENKKETKGLFKIFAKVNAISKMSKTVYSPGSAVANVISAFLLNVYNGHIPVVGNPAGYSELTDFLKIAMKGGDLKGADSHISLLYETALRNGVIDQSVQKKEVDQAMKELSSTNTFEEFMDKWLGGTNVGKLIEKASNVRKKIKKGHEWFYSMGDDFPKFMMWTNDIVRYTKSNKKFQKTLKENNGDVNKAYNEFMSTDEYKQILSHTANIAKNIAPTYSKIPDIVNSLRKTPVVGTFVAFPAESIRTMFNTGLQAIAEMKDPQYRSIGVKRFAGFLTGMTMWSAIGAATKAALGIDDEEDKAIRELAPPWSKYTDWWYEGVDKDGNIKYTDLSRFDTFGYPKQILEALLTDGVGAGLHTLKEPFISESFATKTALELWEGKTREGKDIYYDVEATEDKVAKSFERVFKNVFQTGYSRMANEVYKAATDEENIYGAEYNVEDALQGFVGFRSYTINPSVSFRFNSKKLKNRLEDSRKIYYAGRYKEDPQVVVVKANEALAREYDSFHKLWNAAIAAGIKEEDMRGILKELRISNSNVNRIINNDPEVLLTEEDKKAVKAED